MTSDIRIRVISLDPDFDQITGDPYTKVTFAIELKMPPPPAELMKAYPPLPKNVAWKHIMHLMIPNSKWHGQYQIWKEYELTIDDTNGELYLKPIADEV